MKVDELLAPFGCAWGTRGWLNDVESRLRTLHCDTMRWVQAMMMATDEAEFARASASFRDCEEAMAYSIGLRRLLVRALELEVRPMRLVAGQLEYLDEDERV